MFERPPRVIVTASPYGSLTHALECARLLAPLDHISIVSPAREAARARIEIDWYDGIRMFVHVREQSTPDVLVPLAHIFAEDPLASVVILPSELCVAEPHVTANAIRRVDTRHVSIIGLGDGASFVTVGPVTAFWDILREERPLHAAVFENYLEAIDSGDEGTLIVAAYQHLPPIDFIGDVVTNVRVVEKLVLPTSAMRTNVMTVLSRARLRSRRTSSPPVLRPSIPDRSCRTRRPRGSA